MTVVTSRIVDTAGAPVPAVYVYAWLDATSPELADGGSVSDRANTYTGRDGRWRLDLPPSSSMLDPAARWVIREVGWADYVGRVPDLGPVEASELDLEDGEDPGDPAGRALLPYAWSQPREAAVWVIPHAGYRTGSVLAFDARGDHADVDVTPGPDETRLEWAYPTVGHADLILIKEE